MEAESGWLAPLQGSVSHSCSGEALPLQSENVQAKTIHFDEFEIDLGRYELRRNGRVLKLEKLPMELLILLAEREGQLVTREEIIQRLWGNDVFVDTRQGINTAVRKIRLALKDDPDDARIVQTVIGKGYRLAAPISVAAAPQGGASAGTDHQAAEQVFESQFPPAAVPSECPPRQDMQPADGPSAAKTAPISPALARGLFLLIQMGYLALYTVAFAYFAEIQRLGLSSSVWEFVLVGGLTGAAVRLYLISAVSFGYAGAGRLFQQMFPGVIVLDAIWAASPLLLYSQWGMVTLLGVACLAFLPFSQRTLILWAYGPVRSRGGPAAV